MSASTSCNERGNLLLDSILAGAQPDLDVARSLARDGCSDALFRVVVEGLADRFEPRLCDAYASFFSAVLSEVFPDLNETELTERYGRIRIPRCCTTDPKTVFVLSRVTIGADIAVTSVFLNAAKQRFPKARIVFCGNPKNAELFDVEHVAVTYPRTGLLADRLAASRGLSQIVDVPNSIVLDPDSRLSQLGVLPICPENRHFFFESRSYQHESSKALPELASEWCREVLNVSVAEPYLAFSSEIHSGVTVSFGVGENASKRLGEDFETGLLSSLRKERVLLDCGAGGEEAERARAALKQAESQAQSFTGSFAAFAQRIAQSSLYIGYDSAGQHAAAALNVPLVAVFAGQVSQRMFERWKPTGHGRIRIVNADNLTHDEALQQTLRAIQELRTPSSEDTSAD